MDKVIRLAAAESSDALAALIDEIVKLRAEIVALEIELTALKSRIRLRPFSEHQRSQCD